MRIGIVHTVGSPCLCAESVSAGLRKLNHEVLIVNSEEIERHAAALANTCDLVFDHTDTWCGRGMFRPLVRLLLENFGARVVGSSSKACFVADNKSSAKSRLLRAGLPVPPGIVVSSESWKLPEWLRPPLVLKPAFEHMSRGVSLVRAEQDAYRTAGQLLQSLQQPVLVESYIPGLELAVSLIGGPDGIEVLPVAQYGTGEEHILTEGFKLLEPSHEKHKVTRADLANGLSQEIEELARRAFQVLELRDYARFDIRLSPGGSLFFLEANTTPSLEPMEALAVSAQSAGLDYSTLVSCILSAAASRYKLSPSAENAIIHVRVPTGSIELEIPEGVPSPPQSTIELAGLLDTCPGEEALELGCGSGLLSIAMAKLGAKRVIAVDLDPRALAASQRNARRNGVDGWIEVRAGSWYEAIEPADRFDVIVATPPQTPGHHPFGPKYGGADGTRNLFKIIRDAPKFLKPGGRLWLIAISLANPAGLLRCLRECFDEVVLARETERRFTPGEYGSLEEGLFEYLRALRASGISEFREDQEGRCSFRNLFIRAGKPVKR